MNPVTSESPVQSGAILGLAFGVVALGTAVIDPSRLPLLFIPLSSWLACYGTGASLEWATGSPPHQDRHGLGSMVRRMSTGLALLSFIALLSGLAGVFWLAGIVVVANMPLPLWRLFKEIRLVARGGWPTLPHRCNLISGGLFGLIGLIAWLWATIPPVFYDELAYHLVIPERTLATGTLPTYPWVYFTLMPHVSDLWLAWGMAFGGSLGARAMHWGVWIASSLAAWAIIDYFVPPKRDRWSLPFLLMALASSSTWWFLGTLSFAETGLTFSVLSSIVVLGVFPPATLAWIPFGLLLGMTGSMKLSGLGWAAALLAAATVLRWPWRLLLGATSILGLTMSPWWIRASLVTGDPIYPLAYKTFGAVLWNDQSQALLNGDLPAAAQDLGLWGTLQLPIDLVLHPERHGSASDVGILAVLSVSLVLLLPLISRWSADGSSRQLCARAATTFILLSGCVWLATSTTTRFFAPAFVFSTVVLAALSLHARRTVMACLGILLIPCAGWGTWQFLNTHHQVFSSATVALGQEGREAYLRRELPYYDAARYVATTVPTTARLLFIGEARPYYFFRDALAPYPFNIHPLTQWVIESPTTEDLASRLATEGITHVVLNIPEFRRLQSHYHVLQFTGDQAALYDRRLHGLPRVLHEQFARNGVHIFEVPHSP